MFFFQATAKRFLLFSSRFSLKLVCSRKIVYMCIVGRGDAVVR